MRLVPGFAVFALSSSLALAATQDNNAVDFVSSIRSGAGLAELPPGMPSTQKLYASFQAEPRVVDWATQAEARLLQAINRMRSGEIRVSQVSCHSTICEAVFEVLATDDKVSPELSQFLGAASQDLGKELTLGIGGKDRTRTVVVVYLHDEGSGL